MNSVKKTCEVKLAVQETPMRSFWLVVSTLKNMSQNGFIFPNFRGENIKKYLKKPPPRFEYSSDTTFLQPFNPNHQPGLNQAQRFYLSSPDRCATNLFELTVQIGQSNPWRFFHPKMTIPGSQPNTNTFPKEIFGH